VANIGIVNNFFNFFATTPPDLNHIQNFVPTVFSPDTPTGNPLTPTLGIAAGNQTNANLSLGPQNGPQFLGQSNIITCFQQIFLTSFKTATFVPLPAFGASNPKFCYSSADGMTIDPNPMIIVPAILHTGNQAKGKPWFPYGHPMYSKPLSDIEPDGNQTSDVPACVVFTFDPTASSNPLIWNLAIFIDRWQMAVDLWPNTGHGKHQPRPFPTP
jgi:hypothetical protein